MTYGHNRRKYGRNLIVKSVNTNSLKTVDQLTERDWQLHNQEPTSAYRTLEWNRTNTHAVRELNQAVVDGLKTWNGRSATIEDAVKIAAPVVEAMKKWKSHGADGPTARDELFGILVGLGFNEDALCR